MNKRFLQGIILIFALLCTTLAPVYAAVDELAESAEIIENTAEITEAQSDTVAVSGDEYGIAPLADTDMTVDAYDLVNQKNEQYNTNTSSAYASRNTPEESVDTQTGALILNEVDFSVPWDDITFEIKRIFNSSGARQDLDYESRLPIAAKKDSFYNETYHLGYGWRFSFPALEILRQNELLDSDGKDDTIGKNIGKDIYTILYHSESGAVYSIIPDIDYELAAGKVKSIEHEYQIYNHALSDIEVDFYFDDHNSDTGHKLERIYITHRKQGIVYTFNREGKILQIRYNNGVTSGSDEASDHSVLFNYDGNGRLEKIILNYQNNAASHGNLDIDFMYNDNDLVSEIKIKKEAGTNNYYKITYEYQDKCLDTVRDTDGKTKSKYFYDRKTIAQRYYLSGTTRSINLDLYTITGILHSRTNRLSCYEYEKFTNYNNNMSDRYKVSLHQDYTVKGIGSGENSLHGYEVESIGPKTSYSCADDLGINEISTTSNIFEWNIKQNADDYFVGNAHGYKTLKFRRAESGSNEVKVYMNEKSDVYVNGVKAELQSGEEKYIYAYAYDGSADGDGIYTISIKYSANKWDDNIARIVVSNVAKYIPNDSRDNDFVADFTDSAQYNKCWIQNEETAESGKFNLTPQYIYSWHKMHCEAITTKQYSDFVLDTSIKFMDDTLDKHTSAGVIFWVNNLNPGNNNFDGYYVRISPETDTATNQSSIALFKMHSNNNDRYGNTNEEKLEFKTFSEANLGEACDSSKSYALRVKAVGPIVEIYVVDMINPVIVHDCSEDPYSYGYGSVGVRTYQRRAAFSSFSVTSGEYKRISTKTISNSDGKKTVINDIYDFINNLMSTQSVCGNYKTVVSYEYDSHRMPKQMSVSEYERADSTHEFELKSTKSESYVYDSLGNLTEYRDAMVVKAEDSQNNAPLPTGIVRYEYDEKWCMPTSKTVIKDDSTTITTAYELTAEKNRIAKETISENGVSVRSAAYEYDKSGCVTKKETKDLIAGNDTKVVEYSYYRSSPVSLYSIREIKTSDNIQYITEHTYTPINGNLTQIRNIIKDNNKTNAQEETINSIKYEYDGADRLKSTTYSGGTESSVCGYEYSKSNYDPDETDSNSEKSFAPYSSIYKDENGYLTKTVYDAYGRVVETMSGGTDKDKLNVSVTMTYDESGNLSSVKDGNGNVTRYTYDEINRPIKKAINDVVYETYSYGYEEDANNPTVTTTYPGAGSETVTYDLKGREIKRTDGLGNSTTTEYDYMDNKTAITVDVTNTAKQTTRFTYDALGRLLTSTKANDDVTKYTYNVFDNLETKTEGNNVFEYTYDKTGRVTEEKAHLAGENSGYYSAFTYDGNGNVLTSEKGNYTDNTKTVSEKLTYEYDYRNRPIKKGAVIDQDEDGVGGISQLTEYTYDGVGNLTEEVEHYGGGTNDVVLTSRTYDYAGNVLSEIVTMGGAEQSNAEYTYDYNGNLTKAVRKDVIGTDSITESYTYDSKNHLKTATSPVGLVTTYTYDNRDNVTRESYTRTINGTSQLVETKYGYDAAGRLTSKTDPEGNTTTYEYDKAGNLVKMVEPRNQNTNSYIRYEYDGRNRLTKTIAADNGAETVVEELDYNAAGNVTQKKNGTIVTTYEYDVVGNPTKVTTGKSSVYSSYDGSGRVTWQKDGNGNETKFAYYFNGLPKSVTYADGVVTNYSTSDFDDTGKYRVTSRPRMGKATVTENNIFGKPTRIIYPDGLTESFTYDGLGRMLTSTDRAGTVISYVYDKNGNLTKKSYTNKWTEGSTTKTAEIVEIYAYSSDNLLLSYIDPKGNITTYSYNKAGNLTSVSYPNGTGEAYNYSKGALTSQTVNGVTTAFSYDSRGNVISQTTGDRTLNFTYDAAGNLAVQTNPDGGTVAYEYNAEGLLAKQTAGQSIAMYDYDGNGNVIEETLNTTPGSQKTYTYDKLNNLTEVNDNGAVTSYGYDKLNRPVKVTLDGSTTESFYDAIGNVYAVRNAKNQITLYSYDALGRVLTVADSISHPGIESITSATDGYDSAQAKILEYIEKNKITAAMTYDYDSMGNMVSETNVLGYANTYTYDKCGRVVTVTTPDGVTASTKIYDGLGNLKTDTDAKGNVTSYEYTNNRLTSEAVNNTVYKTYEYNSYGELSAMTDGEGNKTEYVYDSCGRLLKVGIDEDQTKYTYDGEGNKLTMKRASGATTSYEYGPFGRLTSITDADNNVESYEYDARGNLTRKIDGNGNEVTYGYDNKNNLTQVRYDDKLISYSYDALNNRTAMTDESGHYEYSYDSGNRLTKVKKDGSDYVTYTYDKLGNIERVYRTLYDYTSYTYDECSRLRTVTGEAGGTITYAYDENGNLKSTTFPTGKTEYDYDNRNRVTSVVNTVDGNVLSSYSYEYYNNDLEKSKTDHTGKKTEYEYDRFGRLKKVSDGTRFVWYYYDYSGNIHYTLESYDKDFTPHVEYLAGFEPDFGGGQDGEIEEEKGEDNGGLSNEYEWEDLLSLNPNIRTQTANLGGTEVAYEYKYTFYGYTNADRLTSVSERYEKLGNYVEDPEKETHKEDSFIEVAKKITRYVYDNAGNQISTAAEYILPAKSGDEEIGEGPDSVVEVTINEYNGLNQLVNTTNIKDGKRTFANYVYNGDGLRVQKTVDGAVTDYVYSGDYIIAETGRSYIHGLSYHGVIQRYEAYYYFCNSHGDVTEVVSSSQGSSGYLTVAKYEYDEFGNITSQTGDFDNSVRYSGEFFDSETENYYLRSRYYDPSIGRFTQQDSFLGFEDNPLSLNRYTYCHNNPIRYVDPSGFAAGRETVNGIAFVYDDHGNEYAFKSLLDAFKNSDIYFNTFFKLANEQDMYVAVPFEKDDPGLTDDFYNNTIEYQYYSIWGMSLDKKTEKTALEYIDHIETNNQLSAGFIKFYVEQSGGIKEGSYNVYQGLYDSPLSRFGYEPIGKTMYDDYNYSIFDALGWMVQTGGRINFFLQTRVTKIVKDAIKRQENVLSSFIKAISMLNNAGESVKIPRFYLGTLEYRNGTYEDKPIDNAGYVEIYNAGFEYANGKGFGNMIAGIYWGVENSSDGAKDAASFIHAQGGEIIWVPYTSGNLDAIKSAINENYFDAVIIQPNYYFHEINQNAWINSFEEIFSIVNEVNSNTNISTRVGIAFEVDMGLFTGRTHQDNLKIMASPNDKKVRFNEYLKYLDYIRSTGMPIGIYSGGPNEQGYANPYTNNNTHNYGNHIIWYHNDDYASGVPYSSFTGTNIGNPIYDINNYIINGIWSYTLEYLKEFKNE